MIDHWPFKVSFLGSSASVLCASGRGNRRVRWRRDAAPDRSWRRTRRRGSGSERRPLRRWRTTRAPGRRPSSRCAAREIAASPSSPVFYSTLSSIGKKLRARPISTLILLFVVGNRMDVASASFSYDSAMSCELFLMPRGYLMECHVRMQCPRQSDGFHLARF